MTKMKYTITIAALVALTSITSVAAKDITSVPKEGSPQEVVIVWYGDTRIEAPRSVHAHLEAGLKKVEQE